MKTSNGLVETPLFSQGQGLQTESAGKRVLWAQRWAALTKKDVLQVKSLCARFLLRVNTSSKLFFLSKLMIELCTK